MKLRPFQRQFLAAVENPEYDTIALSGPRGLGKTFIAATLLARCLTPGDSLFTPGREVILGAATLETARLCYGFIREWLEPSGEYRFIDSVTRLGITHIKSNTKLRAISSNAKGSFGLVRVNLVVIDEPGALEINGGQMLADSLFTAQGKVGSRLKVVMIGTLAPMATDAGHWWYDLIDTGTKGRTYVQHFRGDLETWDKWPTIRRANPLIGIDAHSRKVILEERTEARNDSRLKARFCSYRLNIPSQDEASTLLTVDDWKRVEARPVPEREGRPIVACDLGGGRAWSAAVAWYPNGLIDAIAVCPGVPSVAEQEKRDRQPAGTYQRLVDAGLLRIADGLRVPHPRQLWEGIREEWGRPEYLIVDRFRLSELQDAVKNGARIQDRVTRWSEAAYDIRALRKAAKDGPLSVTREARALVAASLSVSRVVNDTSGNVRLQKRDGNNQSRDDVAACLPLAAGAMARKPARTGGVYLGMA